MGWWGEEWVGLMPIGREAERKFAFLCIGALQERQKKTEPALQEDKDDDAVTQLWYWRGRGSRECVGN